MPVNADLVRRKAGEQPVRLTALDNVSLRKLCTLLQY